MITLIHASFVIIHNTISLLQSNSSIMTLGSIHSISDSRSLALKHESIVNSSTNNATKDGHEKRDDEIEALGGEDFAAVDDG